MGARLGDGLIPRDEFAFGIAAASVEDSTAPRAADDNLARYFQDDWSVSKNLTFNLGLRYELFYPYTETRNRMANFIANPSDPLFGRLIIAGDPRRPRALVTLDKNNFAPRFGFAYRVPRITGLVVRGAYGIFYGQDESVGVNNRLTNNPPFVGLGGISLVSDQLFPSTGFILSSDSLPPRPAPISPVAFALGPASTFPLQTWNGHYTTPYVQEWNLTLEKQLPWNLLWETSYVGNLGLKLYAPLPANQPLTPGPGSPNNRRHQGRHQGHSSPLP